jgi:hypothetical protein
LAAHVAFRSRVRLIASKLADALEAVEENETEPIDDLIAVRFALDVLEEI